MTDWVAKFFGLEEESEQVKHLAKIASVFVPLAALSFMMSTTFYAIFVAQILAPAGPLVSGFALVGILASIGMITQISLDYPTGGLGDWIGQRWIIAFAFIFFAISMFLTTFWARDFFGFLIVFVLQSVGAALQSGAIASWFDTNYRAVAHDPKRTAYSVAQGRMGMLFQIMATACLIPGAILATLFSREAVFFFQAVFCIILAFSSLMLFRDFTEVSSNRPRRSLRAYYTLLKDGLKFSVSSRYVFFYIIGSVLVGSTIVVWGNMLLFLIYYSYLYEDIAVATFRTILFVSVVVWTERAGVWTRNLEPSKWIPRNRILQTCGPIFYILIATITFLLPPLSTSLPFPFMFLQIPALLICIGFILTGIFSSGAGILSQRLMLDLIPDRFRNAIYSLLPSLTLLFAVPQILVFAPLLASYGVSLVLTGCSLVSALGCILLVIGLRQSPPSDLPMKEMPPTAPAPVEPSPPSPP